MVASRPMSRTGTLLFASALAFSIGCGSGNGDAQIDCRADAADCTLREASVQAGVLVGAAYREVSDDPAYLPTLSSDFNSVTHEGAMKWAATQPESGVFNFNRADQMVEFAVANGMTVRGHTLIWEQASIDATPEYVTAITDPDELRTLMRDHIRTVVGHFRGRVDAWDVVNEPLETVGSEVYQNHFYQVLGPGYIAEAFELAHEADPDATLFLNEVLVSNAGAKFDALLALTADLLEQGVPVHGVGLQGHFLISGPRHDELRTNLERLAALGVVVELTEVDIVLRGMGDEATRLERQRQDFFDMASACLAVEACKRITFWGFTDRYTWIDGTFGPGLAPLPLDLNYERKPAYFGLIDGLLSGQ
jgi:endo-1,4-beta-xylanase